MPLQNSNKKLSNIIFKLNIKTESYKKSPLKSMSNKKLSLNFLK